MNPLQSITGGRAWRSIDGRLEGPGDLSRVDHDSKIRARKQRTGIGKYSW